MQHNTKFFKMNKAQTNYEKLIYDIGSDCKRKKKGKCEKCGQCGRVFTAYGVLVNKH